MDFRSSTECVELEIKSLTEGGRVSLTGRYENSITACKIGDYYGIEMWESPPGQEVLRLWKIAIPLSSKETIDLVVKYRDLICERKCEEIFNGIEWVLGGLNIQEIQSKIPSKLCDVDEISLRMQRKERLKESFRCSEELKLPKGVIFALDYTNKIIKISEKIYSNYFSVHDVAFSDVVIKEKNYQETSTGSLITRAAVGGILSGGVAALMLGVTAKKNLINEILRVELVIASSDSQSHPNKILFFEAAANFQQFDGKSAVQKAKQIQSWISDAKISNSKQSEILGNNSLASELASLADLLSKGLISQSEFEAAKSHLLKKA